MLTHSQHQCFKFQLHKKLAVTCVAALFVLTMGLVRPVFAGDSIYGRITEVKSANVVTLDNGEVKFQIRIAGIEAPRERAMAERAKEMVRTLLLGKNARARLETRQRTGELIARLYTDDSEIKDVGVELVRAGLARRLQGRDERFGYKYNELMVAEQTARKSRSGLWAR